MDALEFLRLVVSDSPNKVLAIPNGSGYSHKVVDTYEQMVSQAKYKQDSENVYFALGTLKEPFVWVDDAKTGKQKKGYRLQTNIAKLRAFWMDIDVGENKAKDGKGYATLQEAREALYAFVDKSGLPKPLVVFSGGGLHVYWPLKRDLTPEEWKPTASQLKALARAYGLKADPARTGDCASVLRVPGTINHKYGTVVKVKADGYGPVNPDKLIKHVQKMYDLAIEDGLIQKPAASKRTDTSAARLLDALSGPKSNPDLIVEKCGVFRGILQKRGVVEEPVWYNALSVARHCEGGKVFAWEISQGPAYDETAFETKLAQLESKNIGPATCDTFAQLGCSQCEVCPHKGKIRSPIQLGKHVVAAPAPTVNKAVPVSGPDAEQASAVVCVEIPEPPKPYTRGADGKIYEWIEADEDDDYESFDAVIYEHDLYPVARTFDPTSRREVIRWRHHHPQDGVKEFDIATSDMIDQRGMLTAVLSHIVMPKIENRKALLGYIVAYTDKLQNSIKQTTSITHLGWTDDNSGFILGDRIIHSDGRIEETTPAGASSEVLSAFHKAGSLEDWKRGVSVYTAPGLEAHLFALMTGFGAPLFRLNPTKLEGAIVSMVGASAAGKTTVQKAALSVWGSPNNEYGLLLDPNTTENAFFHRLTVLHSLPACVDEITSVDTNVGRNRMNLDTLCYTVTQGRETARMRASKGNGIIEERRNVWQTMVLASANRAIRNMLATKNIDAEARMLRVFEYELPEKTMKKSDADAALKLFTNNYGHAGEIFAKFVVENRVAVEREVEKYTRIVEEKTGGHSKERFVATVAACNLVAAKIVNALGLMKINEKALNMWAIETIKRMRVEREEVRYGVGEILADYCHEKINELVVVKDSKRRQARTMASLITDSNVLVQPKTNLVSMRVEMDTGTLFIRMKSLRDFATARGTSLSAIIRWAEENGVYKGRENSVVLTKGTSLPGAQTNTVAFDVTKPIFKNLVDFDQEEKPTGNVVSIEERKRK